MPLLKIGVFLFIFIYLVPFVTALCCFYPVFRHICFFGMVYFTSNEYTLNVAPLPYWRGTSRGFMFTPVCFFALSLLLSMIFSTQYKVRLFPPGSIFYLLYWLAILVSGFNAVNLHPWGFEVNKMFWMYLTFLAAFNYLNHCKNLNFFVFSVCSVLIILFLYGLKQKYLDGRYQIRSTFVHQNSLSLYLELFGLFTLGVLMGEEMKKWMFFWVLFGFVSSVMLILFTFSRGGLVVYCGGIAIVGALSILFNGFSVRRLTLMAVGLLVMLSVVGYALPRIIMRFTKAPTSSKNTRINLAIAAKRIADDYFFGVGANNFSEYSGTNFDYAREDHENMSETALELSSGKGGIVETIYLLVAAECGWWGLGTLLLWFFYYYFSVIVSMFVLRKKPCSGIVIGLFGGLTCVYWHSTLEWSLKQNNNFSQQVILYALIGVIAVHRKSIKAAWKRSQAEKKQAMLEKKRKKRRLDAIPVPATALPAPVVAENVDLSGSFGAPVLSAADPVSGETSQ